MSLNPKIVYLLSVHFKGVMVMETSSSAIDFYSLLIL